MKEKILILALSALVVVQFFLSFTKSEHEGIPDYYKEQYKERQEEIDGLYIDLKETKEQIKLLEYEIALQDSIILGADKSELREISNRLIGR